MKRSKPSIAVIYPISVPWMAECLRGIKRHADEVGGWNIITTPPSLQSTAEEVMTLSSVRRWKCSGVIAMLASLDEERVAAKLPMPVVNLAGWCAPRKGGVPRVNANHQEIGRMAADHFLTFGLQHVAYYGFEGVWYSEERSVGLERRAKELSLPFSRFLHPLRHAHAPAWHQVSKPLAAWLRKLPKPVGILAVHDYRARVILSLCEQIGFRVPEEVAVLGIDNDPIICEYSSPTLSSVSRDPVAYGVAAAQQLECLLNKKTLEQHTILISPGGVVQRQSTQRLYSGDPVIRQVADYLSQQSPSRVNVQSVAKHLKLSRRTLELHFKEHLQMTPGSYIQAFRITRAKSLLLQRDVYQTISEIAYAAGFGSVPAFRAAFHSHTGKTPSNYRKLEGAF